MPLVWVVTQQGLTVRAAHDDGVVVGHLFVGRIVIEGARALVHGRPAVVGLEPQ